jgi:hypothetical protein
VTVTAGPYEAKFPRADAPAGGYPTAEQELATALEGQAPTLARELAGLLGPVRTVKLAQAIGRAVAVGINRRAEAELADRMHGLYAVLEDGLQMVEPDCVAPEQEPCEHGESLYGRCVACGMTWEQQAVARG